jgi:hypothetical protein
MTITTCRLVVHKAREEIKFLTKPCKSTYQDTIGQHTRTLPVNVPGHYQSTYQDTTGQRTRTLLSEDAIVSEIKLGSESERPGKCIGDDAGVEGPWK